MAKNKNQHVVPRGYINQFIDPISPPTRLGPFVWVYERGGSLPFPKSPKKLTVKSYYYSWFSPEGERSDAADEVLQAFEDRGIPILKRLDSGVDSLSLAPQERSDFANFAALLRLRVPQFRNAVEKFRVDLARIHGQLAAAHPGYLEQWAKRHYPKLGKPVPSKAVIEKTRALLLNKETKIRVDPLVSLQAMLQMMPTVARYIFESHWRLLRAPEGSHFIAGDMPLVQITTEKLPPLYRGVGWGTPYMEATLPLSPRSCLLISLHHPSGQETSSAETVREINLRSATNAGDLVYSSRLIHPGTLNKPDGWTWWTPASEVVDLSWLEGVADEDDAHDSTR
jgi:Protein of unknown function (DUF4238)